MLLSMSALTSTWAIVVILAASLPGPGGAASAPTANPVIVASGPTQQLNQANNFSVVLEFSGTSYFSEIILLLREAICVNSCPGGEKDFVPVDGAPGTRFVVRVNQSWMMAELLSLPQQWLSHIVTTSQYQPYVKLPVKVTPVSPLPPIESRGSHQVSITVEKFDNNRGTNTGPGSYVKYSVMPDKIIQDLGHPGTSASELHLLSGHTTYNSTSRKYVQNFTLSCETTELQVAIAGTEWATFRGSDVFSYSQDMLGAAYPSYVALDVTGAPKNETSTEVNRVSFSALSAPQGVFQNGATLLQDLAAALSNGTSAAAFNASSALVVAWRSAYNSTTSDIGLSMVASFPPSVNTRALTEAANDNGRLAHFTHLRAERQECWRFDYNACTTLDWCQWSDSLGGCAKVEEAALQCSDLVGADILPCQEGFATECQFCPKYGVCRTKGDSCPELCSSIVTPANCEAAADCRWTGYFCSSSVCFSFIEHGFEVMPFLTFIVAVIKASLVLLLWSVVGLSARLWFRRKCTSSGKEIPLLFLDEIPIADSAKIEPFIDPEWTVDDYARELLIRKFGFDEPTSLELDSVIDAMCCVQVFIELHTHDAPIANQEKSTQTMSTLEEVIDHITDYEKGTEGKCKVCWAASRTISRRFAAAIDRFPETFMLCFYVTGIVFLLTISAVEVVFFSDTAHRNSNTIKFQLVGFRLLNSALPISFMLVMTKWLRVGFLRVQYISRRHLLTPSQRLAVIESRRNMTQHFMFLLYLIAIAPFMGLAFLGLYHFPLPPLACIGVALFSSAVLRPLLHCLIEVCVSNPEMDANVEDLGITVNLNSKKLLLSPEESGEELSGDAVYLSVDSKRADYNSFATREAPPSAAEAGGHSVVRNPIVATLHKFIGFVTVDAVWATALAIAFQMGYNYAVLYLNGEMMNIDDLSGIPSLEYHARSNVCLEHVLVSGVNEVSHISHKVQLLSVITPFL